nr:MAG TPA: hypothetical protein [Caudoviricetes sp.]
MFVLLLSSRLSKTRRGKGFCRHLCLKSFLRKNIFPLKIGLFVLKMYKHNKEK